MPALILEFVIDVMCDKQANLTADVAAIFANGDPSKASPLNTLCHLEKIAYLLQIPKLANLVNNSLPNTARNHPALAFAEALQQVPIHKKLAYAALRHFDIELAHKCCFHFWRRICAIQASKFYDVNFNEYEWQRLAHLRFVLAIYSERPLKTSRVRAGFDWKHIALRFLEYMCSEEPDFVPSGGDETSVAGPSGTSGG
ncbi:hypothetical protein QFC19_004176 [Naganishia cerealis]|uniref:Uncharacterized protein n=1 Tax=Naganishia cerealis TaxID=610337 RepID=A0ACC2W062_9TREE|nr:hypothetical protein QFC19_004176 [Naganishia cerealis]